MRKRPLCMICLVLLAIQLVRVSFLQNTKDQKPSLAETLISDEKDVICEGTVYKIENKSQSTAIYLKDAVVSCTDQKSKNQTIKEKKILITIKNSKSGKRIRMEIGQKLNVRGTKQSFHPPRNPGNFNQKSYYQKQGIHVGVLTKAEQVEIVLSEKDKNWIVSQWDNIQNQLDRLKNYWNWKIVSQIGKTHGAMLSAILLGEKSGLDPEMKKLYQKNGLGHLLVFRITHVTDRNVCLPAIKKNGKFISVFRNCRRRDSVFLSGYDRATGIQSSCTSYVFYPHGGRNYRERCGSANKPGGYSSYLKHISTVVSARCGIFTFIWCNPWDFIIVSNF